MAALYLRFGQIGFSIVDNTLSIVNNATQLPYELAAGTVATPTKRALNTDFIVSKERDAFVFYTVELTVAAQLLGVNNRNADIILHVDGVPVSEAMNKITSTFGPGISISALTHRTTLCAYVTRGQTVKLTTSGNGTMSLIHSQEVLL